LQAQKPTSYFLQNKKTVFISNTEFIFFKKKSVRFKDKQKINKILQVKSTNYFLRNKKAVFILNENSLKKNHINFFF